MITKHLEGVIIVGIIGHTFQFKKKKKKKTVCLVLSSKMNRSSRLSY